MKGDEQSDRLVALVRKSNSGSEGGRSATCWVIGDPEFVKDAVASAEANRLRISRFEREGGSLGTIADTICRKFGIRPELLKERHRGGAAPRVTGPHITNHMP